MRHLGLFAGIGGFELAARWAGWKTVAWCEWNEFGQKILRHHFPEAEGFGDITKTDFTKYANKIDIVTGGFPCQPFSSAGKRKGTEDNRHLWPEMLRAIREIRPRWIVGENVHGILTWSRGLVFEQVQIDLENEGYEVQSFVLPACAKNAPHRRDRVWFVAYNDHYGQNLSDIKNEVNPSKRGEYALNDTKSVSDVANSNEKRWTDAFISQNNIIENKQGEAQKWSNPWNEFTLVAGNGYSQTDFYNGFDYQPTVIRIDDGISSQLDELEAFGNAVVPQIPYEIFKAINRFETP